MTEAAEQNRIAGITMRVVSGRNTGKLETDWSKRPESPVPLFTSVAAVCFKPISQLRFDYDTTTIRR